MAIWASARESPPTTANSARPAPRSTNTKVTTSFEFVTSCVAVRDRTRCTAGDLKSRRRYRGDLPTQVTKCVHSRRPIGHIHLGYLHTQTASMNSATSATATETFDVSTETVTEMFDARVKGLLASQTDGHVGARSRSVGSVNADRVLDGARILRQREHLTVTSTRHASHRLHGRRPDP